MTVYLVFRDTMFYETQLPELKDSDLAVLSIDGKECTLYLNESITLIDKLTAERQVNSIIKTGFLLQNNQRVGALSILRIVTGAIPNKSGHDEKILQTATPHTQKPQVSVQTQTESTGITQVKQKQKLVETEGPLIIPPIEKEDEGEETEPLDEGFEQTGSNEVIINNRPKNGPSIADLFREEQKNIMAEPIKEAKKITTVYEEVIEYFWKELFGQVFSSWDSLPQKAKEDFFATLNIKHLTNEEVQELFKIRHENNMEAFKTKLNDFKNKYK